MSYILDALRKAEMERELSRVPGISSRQHFARAVARFPAKAWLVVVAALVLGMAIAWLWLKHETAQDNKPALAAREGAVTAHHIPPSAPPLATNRQPAPVTAKPVNTASMSPVHPVAAVAVESPQPKPAPATEKPINTAPMSPAHPVPAAAVEPATAARAVQPQRPVAVAKTAQHNPAVQVQTAYHETGGNDPMVAMIAAEAERGWPAKPVSQPAKPAESAAQTQPADNAAKESASEEELPPLLSTLPYRFQSTLPKIMINAQAYASEAAARFVIINMKKYREGERTEEGVLIENIAKEYLVLSYQGQVFRMQR